MDDEAVTTRSPAVVNAREPVRWVVGISALLVLAVFSVYWRALDAPFLFDDIPAIKENPTIRSLWPLSGPLSPPSTAAGAVGRPVVNLTLALNYAGSGVTPRGYHAFNIALHALVCLALFGVIRRTLLLPRLAGRFGARATLLAGAIAALWALHPIQSESVIGITQRTELLGALFWLLTLYSFSRSVGSARAPLWRVCALTSCAVGMASKEWVVSAPLAVLLYDWIFVGATFLEIARRRWRFYGGLASTWMLLAWLMLHSEQRGGTVGFGLGISSWHYLLTQCKALVLYVKLSVWPHPLVIDYGWPVVTSLATVWLRGAAIVIALGATVWLVARRSPLGFLGFVWFVILAPSSSFVPLTTQTIAEHRMYLPSAVVVTAAVAGVATLLSRPSLLAILAAASLGGLTAARCADYRTGMSIWRDTLRKHTENARAHNNLAFYLVEEGRTDEAIAEFTEATRLHPAYSTAHANIGHLLVRAGKYDAALARFEAALRVEPDNDDLHLGAGTALAQLGRSAEAQKHFEAATRANPRSAVGWSNLGTMLLRQAHVSEASQCYAKAVSLDPEYTDARRNLGEVLLLEGHANDAVVHLRAALNLDPQNTRTKELLEAAMAALSQKK